MTTLADLDARLSGFEMAHPDDLDFEELYKLAYESISLFKHEHRRLREIADRFTAERVKSQEKGSEIDNSHNSFEHKIQSSSHEVGFQEGMGLARSNILVILQEFEGKSR